MPPYQQKLHGGRVKKGTVTGMGEALAQAGTAALGLLAEDQVRQSKMSKVKLVVVRIVMCIRVAESRRK